MSSKERLTGVYPLNPNRNPVVITGAQTPNLKEGVLVLPVPHPECVVDLKSNSWHPQSIKDAWDGTGP